MGVGRSVCRERGPIPKTHEHPVFPDPLTSIRSILVSSADIKGKSLILYFSVLTDQDFLSFLGGLCLLEFPCGGRGCSGAGNGEAFAKAVCKRLSGPVL